MSKANRVSIERYLLISDTMPASSAPSTVVKLAGIYGFLSLSCNRGISSLIGKVRGGSRWENAWPSIAIEACRRQRNLSLGPAFRDARQIAMRGVTTSSASQSLETLPLCNGVHVLELQPPHVLAFAVD